MTKKIQLGATYIDKVTGFRGIAVELSSYLSGCDQVLLRPPCKEDGEFQKGVWFDDLLLDQVSDVAAIKINKQPTQLPGGRHPEDNREIRDRH